VKYYAGIGSRETPAQVCRLMTHIAVRLYQKGWTCRTGGADGADLAFENGAAPKVEVYVPWQYFNGRPHGIVCGEDLFLRDVALRHHPRWSSLREPVRKLMTRNSAQIIGHCFGDPVSEFVICWTPKGKVGGGTGQAIRVARSYGVPVYNLFNYDDREKVRELCI
jgi:hypothetical protein